MLVVKQSYNTVELIHSTVYDSDNTYYINRRYGSKTATGELTKLDDTLYTSFTTLNDGWYYFEVHELPNNAGITTSYTYYYNTDDDQIYYYDGATQQVVDSLDNRTPDSVLNYLVKGDAINLLSDKIVVQANLDKCFDDCNFLVKFDTVDALTKEEGFKAAHDLVTTLE